SSGDCANKYTAFKVFLTVEKTLANGQKVNVGANDYEIQEQVKCVTEDNPRGLAVVPDQVPEAGATFRVAYEARILTSE
ncbi:MAG: hypothetical protein KC609_24915, partial [Myxococcales bacterium]|nr:hypothetical protein [Myxococcales bacterium]